MREDGAPVAGVGCATLVLILSAVGVAVGLSAAALSALLAVVGPQTAGLDSAAAALAAVALLGLPLGWQAWLRLRGVAQPPWRTRRWWIGVALLAAPASLLIGHLLSNARGLPTVLREPWLWLTLVTFAAALLALTTDGWSGLSRLRVWGHLVSGGWAATTLAMGLTVLAVAGMLVIGVTLLAALAPEELRELMRLARNPSALADTTRLMAWATRPYVIAGAMLLAAVVVPLIEELVKPVGVWALWSCRPTPMAAFVGGALGGLGFALVEALLNSASVGRDQWAGFVVGRLATTVMHVWASALTGWGIGQLFAGKWGRAILAYLGAVLVHGLWNGNVIVASLSATLLLTGAGAGAWKQITLGATVGLAAGMLVGLALSSIFTLLLVGRWLRDQESPP